MTRSNGERLLRGGGLALFVLVVAACSTTGGGGVSRGGNPDLITRDQIDPLQEGTAFTVVQRLRPNWLRPRSMGTPSNPQPTFPEVFVDEIHFGDGNSLGRISSTNIESIQFISAPDATTRYGTGYPGGIIRVNTIKR